jgi:hypothetical protein
MGEFLMNKISYNKGYQEAKKELFLDIIKRKFDGKVRDFLIWYGGKFKDIEIVELSGDKTLKHQIN